MPKNRKSRRSKSVPRTQPTQPANWTASLANTLPAVGFVALAVATCLVPSETPPAFGLEIPLIMLWLLLLGGWSIAGLLRREMTIRCDAATVAFLLFFGWLCFSSAVNLSDSRPRATLNMTFRWLSFGVMFLLARQLLVDMRTRRAMVAIVLALVTGISAMGVYQYAVTFPATRARYEADPQQAMYDAGVMAPRDSPIGQQFRDRVLSTEPLATFALTNSLAGVIAPWLLIGVALAWQIGKRLSEHDDSTPAGLASRVLPLIGLCLAIIILAFCLLLTKSRSAWGAVALGLLMLGGVALAKGLRAPWLWLAGGAALVVLLVAGAVMVGALDREVMSEAAKSLSYRLQFWQSTAAMIAERPLVGVGVGNFQEHYAAYKLPEASEMISDPHNFPLEIAANMGLPALLLFASGLLLLAWYAWQAIRNSYGKTSSSLESSLATSTWPLYVGVALGFVLAIPLQIMSTGVIGETLLVIAPVTALTLVLLHGWVCVGKIPYFACTVGLLALLVNLLAAGGISFASVTLHVWLLAVLLLAGQGGQGKWWWTWQLSRGRATLVVAASFLLVAVFYLLAYRPVLQGRLALETAERLIQQGSFAAAEQPAAVAVEADPWNEAGSRLAAIAAQRQWLQRPSEELFRRFESSADDAIRLNPQTHTLRAELSRLYLEAYRTSESAELLAKAIEYQQQAIDRYPNDSWGHAQLAWLYWNADRQQEAQQQAELALKLDQINTHADRALANQQLHDTENHQQEVASALETMQRIVDLQ